MAIKFNYTNSRESKVYIKISKDRSHLYYTRKYPSMFQKMRPPRRVLLKNSLGMLYGGISSTFKNRSRHMIDLQEDERVA